MTLIISSLNAQELKPLKKVSIALAWKHQFQFAGYYMAKELGYYKDAGLDVEIKEFQVNENISEEVSNRTYEFGVGHSDLLSEKLDKYQNLVLLLAMNQSSPLVLLTKKRNDILSLEDLHSKTIAFSNQNFFDAPINAMLLSAKISSVQFEPVVTNFKLETLINGKTDAILAYASNEPYLLTQKGVEYTLYDPRDYGYDFYSDFLFTSQEMLDNEKQVVDDFTRASLRGWHYAYEHIDESVALILHSYNTQNKTRKALLYEADILKKHAYEKGIALGFIDDRKLKSTVTTLRLLNLINSTSKLDYTSFIYQPSLSKAKKETQTKKNIFRLFVNKYTNEIKIILGLALFFVLIIFYLQQKIKRTLKEKTKELDKNLEIFDKHVSASRTDTEGKITYVTEALCRATGYTKEELIGKNHRILKYKTEETNLTYRDLWLTILSGHTWHGEFQNQAKDGTVYWVESIISPIYDAKGELIGYEGIRKDITQTKFLQNFNKKLEEEVKKKTEVLQKLATTDKLTEIYNRVKIDEDLAQNFLYYKNNAELFSVIMIDIDFFKNVNDTHGHQVGDIILQSLAKLVSEVIRSSDIFGRWGGEEFMVICPHTDVNAAITLAQKINDAVREHSFDRVQKLTVSIGVADIQGCSSSDAVVNRTDKALYKAKESGRDRVESAKC